MHDNDDFYDGLLEGLFWFFWPKRWAQWVLYFALFAGICYFKDHQKPARATPPATQAPPVTGEAGYIVFKKSRNYLGGLGYQGYAPTSLALAQAEADRLTMNNPVGFEALPWQAAPGEL